MLVIHSPCFVGKTRGSFFDLRELWLLNRFCKNERVQKKVPKHLFYISIF